MLPLLASAWLLAAYGCLDPLPEGTFACAEEGRSAGCPRGWYCRYGDEAENELRCYSTPGEEPPRAMDASTAGGGISDGDEAGVDDADSGTEDTGAEGTGAEGSDGIDVSDASAADSGMDADIH